MRATIIASLATAAALVAATRVHPGNTPGSKPALAPLETAVIETGVPGESVRKVEGPSYASPPTGPALAPSCPPASPLAGSSYKTFGNYNPAKDTAIENDVWTFDHGAGGWEGWRREDLTTNPFVAFQRVDSIGWSAHGNTSPAPIIDGAASAWVGFHEDQADSACWLAGLGYGDNWAQRITSPVFVNSAGATVYMQFLYWYDSESGFDQTRLIINQGGTETTVATFSGVSGGPFAPLAFGQFVAVTGSFRVIFEFTSDGSWSDVDDNYSTIWGPFGFDDFSIVGLEGNFGPAFPHTFETSLSGWMPTAVSGVGSYAALNDFAAYPYAGCGHDANVVTFHNLSAQHPAGQHERITSPRVNTSSYGTDPLNVWAEYDYLGDEPLAENVFWTWGFQYYPVVCPVTGDSMWSDPAGPGLWFYNATPLCARIRSYANDPTSPASVYGSGTTLIPAGADSVRFFLEVYSTSLTDSGNETPIFDNIRIGVSNATNILHVPSPQYPTIQQGIAGANPGDSVVVAPGIYTGGLNRNLDFDGTNLAVIAEGGPDVTTIDCERLGRAFYFHSGETAASLVDGFSIVHGTAQAIGGAIYVINSSPRIRNCKVSNTTVNGAGYAVIRIDSGSPTFECNTVFDDTSTASGGIIRVLGGSPDFESCTIADNTSQFSCVALLGGSPTLNDCLVSNNNTTNAIIVLTAIAMSGCEVTNNGGIAMYLFQAPASTISTSSFSYNLAGGISMESNSSTFTSCTFNANQGPGVVISNVATVAAEGPQSASPSGTASTSPYFLDCTVAGNINTSSSGGGVLFDCGNVPTSSFTPIYDNCTITGNSSLFSGGGIAVCGQAVYTDIAPLFENCTVSANNAYDNGGGFYVSVDNGGGAVYFGWVTITRCIMWGNCADGVGDQAYLEANNYMAFDCSNFDMPGVEGSGDVVLNSAQVFDDPEFCGAPACASAGTIEGDFSITEGSPVDSTLSPCHQLIGAAPVLCTPAVGVEDAPETPERTALWQNVPNPFNPVTSIRLDLAQDGRVTLTVYDVAGRAVRHLVDAYLPASTRTVEWDGLDDKGGRVATGVYFLRLVASDLVETRKLVLVK